jgi:MFS transporter, Spinster family, sphingosine-1-phosphate transporter
VTRASTGIDDSSYPGLFTLVADYFGPNLRGKIYGILQLAQPLGYLVGIILALIVAPMIGGWRSVFYITGALGIVIAAFIFFGVREMPRGKAEPEFEKVAEMQTFRFSWAEAQEIFKKRTMWFVFLQGFAGQFPWTVVIYFFFGYLITERGYDNDAVLVTMAPVILILSAGYFIGGWAGDVLFKRTNKGRIIVSSIGVLMGAIFLYSAVTTPVEARTQFFVLMCLTAVFMPLSSPNVIATVYDVTVPEVRSTAQASEYFVENTGAAFAPILTGSIADAVNLQTAITLIPTIAWGLCFLFYLGALFTIDHDTHVLRNQMAERAKAM